MSSNSLSSSVNGAGVPAERVVQSGAFEPRALWLMSGVALLGLALFVARLTGLPAIFENEWRLSAYVLDVLQDGRWYCPTDTHGDLATKPPLLSWLVTILALITGRVDRLELYSPTAVAAVATALSLFSAGRVHFGWRAGLFSGFSYLVCAAGFTQMATARYDGLLAFPVTLGALAAYRAWESGRGWTWFWFWAAVGTLIKGPLALLLAGAGLVAVVWARRSGEGHPLRVGNWTGLAIFFGLTAGWFVLAYLEVGQPLIDTMLERELLGHATGISRSSSPLVGLPMPTLALLRDYAPWSLAAIIAFWRVVRAPASDAVERRFERFVFCWFMVGLIAFSLAAHQRGRLIFPIVPAAALLAGRELARWTRRWSPGTTLGVVGAAGFAVIILAVLYSDVLLKRSHRGQEGVAMHDLAHSIEGLGTGWFPLTLVDDPGSLQVLLNTREQEVNVTTAAGLLAGEAAAFVVVRDADEIQQSLPANARVFEVYRWPQAGRAEMRILSNHPRLEWPQRTVMVLDGLRLEMSDAHLLQKRRKELAFEMGSAASSVVVSNACAQARLVTVRCTRKSGGHSSTEQRLLPPGATWRS